MFVAVKYKVKMHVVCKCFVFLYTVVYVWVTRMIIIQCVDVVWYVTSVLNPKYLTQLFILLLINIKWCLSNTELTIK